jgi:ATP synthase protein I
MTVDKKSFADQVEHSADKLLKSRKEQGSFWHWASRVGVGGWLFVIPVVGGAYLGRYLDRNSSGDISWTVTFILLGITAGIFNLWQFLSRKGDQ